MLTLTLNLSVTEAQGEKVVRIPRVVKSENSQNIELLRGSSNINPHPTQGSYLAVVDNSALVSQSTPDATTFAEQGLSGSGQISVYVVREGDTLSTIAKMFKVSINTIVWANDIKGGLIKPGQTLVILPISGVKHIVAKGDTIDSIAKKYKADVAEILSYNDLTKSSKLSSGDEIIIPDGEVTSVVTYSSGSGSSNTSVASGYFARPIQGGRKTQGLHGHNGIDIGGSIGTPVLASAAGNVIIARSSGYNGGYGLYIVVSHPNGTQTLYAHLSAVNVSVGDKVSKGQVIGKLGNSGKSTGPHLHFEVRGARNPF